MTRREPLPISLVTPNRNGADYLADSLDSIATQAYPSLEHVVVDGASSDSSLAIIQERRRRFSAVISEPDESHAAALNKGFARTSGEIMGWLNSDDMLHPGCLETVDRVFRARPDIMWITGRPSSMNARGELIYAGPARPWSRLRFLSGDCFWIQQESTFWRRDLWKAAGGRLDTGLQVANDFELWARFFRHAELHTVDRMLGCFRVRPGQRSVEHTRLYDKEARGVLARELADLDPAFRARRGAQLPSRPVRLHPREKAAREEALTVDDPPLIEMAALRRGDTVTVGKASAPWPRPAPAELQGETARTPLIESLERNWRFLGAVAVAAAVAVIAGVLFEPLQVWIALAFGVGSSLAVTTAVAIKTRRIVAALDRSVALALAGRAEAEMRRERLELELDRLRMGLPDPQPPSAWPSDTPP